LFNKLENYVLTIELILAWWWKFDS